VTIEGWDIKAVYFIDRKSEQVERLSYDDLITFAPTEYTMTSNSGTTDILCTKKPALCDDLCDLIQRGVLTYKQEKTDDEYRTEYDKFVMQHKHDGVYYDEDSLRISELAEISRLMTEISEDAHLFLRGTADGQTRTWEHALEKDYKFSEVNRFLLDAKCAKRNCWDFGRAEPMQIQDPYNESKLPNLRAEFIRANISSVVGRCRKVFPKEPSIHILDGIDSKDIADPSRTVLGLIVIGHPRE
jgi:hypothetical protein